jgi:hypothetical protein
MNIFICARHVLVVLKVSKEAANGADNFLLYEIEMKIFGRFVMLSLQILYRTCT